ncbi:RAVE subunit 2/Rogdi [Microdochium trichocladiopsis]|uniref:RAVE subunit 2/Rogdi n=1 Tax=Microdochium trichocladiopsis TaxID=1682393 RepID=A0A9P8YCZ0_9PEZI|nr:RAVE subunit 2/Rogdi [Microdochium trichocladiopsis]KAH7037175.1 RAVE subunit 2/Rogdi [Microdochium trichocladiopsis]
MSVEIWPPAASPEQLKADQDAAEARELEWLLSSLRSTLKSLKNELENCYALLAPVEPGSTLVLTTPRHEAVKGTITRVGTRITRAAINLRLKTLPPQILTLSNSANASGAGAGKADDLDGGIYLQPLVDLNTLLSESVDLLTLCVSESAPTTAPTTTSPSSASAAGPTSKRAKVVPSASAADFLSSQLRQLAQNLAEATAILKGAPDPDQRWTSQSVSLSHFAAPRSQSISFYLTVQDASIILYLRALEPADAPMNFGAKLAFAIGTARRLEHDEAEKVFWYVCDQESRPDGSPSDGGSSGGGGSGGGSGGVGGGNGSAGAGAAAARSTGLKRQQTRDKVDVYVREKVKVESADPSLLAMSTKLSALANTLALARRNLAAVMGEDLDV